MCARTCTEKVPWRRCSPAFNIFAAPRGPRRPPAWFNLSLKVALLRTKSERHGRCHSDALLERRVHALRVADLDFSLRPLLAKLREQQPDLGAGTKEVREALAALAALAALTAETEAAKAIKK